MSVLKAIGGNMKFFSKKTVVTATTLIVVGVSVWFYYHSSPILNSRASSWDKADRPARLGGTIDRSFKVPVNYEWWDLVVGRDAAEPLVIQRGDRLKDVLDRATEALDNIVTYKVIHGQLCVVPVKQHPDEILSPLDLRVTVNLGTMSTWEAIKKVVIALNQQKDALDAPVLADPEEVEWTVVVTPLLTEIRKFNLSLQNVTAREALCAIFAASKFEINYQYSIDYFEYYPTRRNPRFHRLIIASHPNRYGSKVTSRERLEGENFAREACWWFQEVDSQLNGWNVVPKYYKERRRWCGEKIPIGLDTKVSVDIVDASLWDALREVVRSANQKETTPQFIFLYPSGGRQPKQPPPELTELRQITISIADDTALQAIRTVMRASSLGLTWDSRLSGFTSFDVVLRLDRERLSQAEALTEKQRDRWKRKIGYHGIRRIPPGREDMLLESTDAYVAHLGLHISVDLEDVSVWEAFQQIVAAANQQTDGRQPLDVLPDALLYDEQPMSALTDLREITLSMQDVTVQEALNAVTAASSLDMSYWYEWQEDAARVLIIPPEKGRHREEADPLTPEERAWWLRERGLQQAAEDPPVWTWTPPGMGTTLEHYSNGQLIPIPNAARNDE